jgi:hypothetical protein
MEVVITKWNGAVPSNYYIAPRPVYGITDNAVNRLTELFFVRQNQTTIMENPYASLPVNLDIANNKIIYLIFFPYRETFALAANGAERIMYAVQGSNQEVMIEGGEMLNEACTDMQNFGFSLAASHSVVVLGFMAATGEGDRDTVYDSYGINMTHYQLIRQMVYEAGMKANMGYNIDDTVLNTYTAPVVRGTTSREIKALPSWSISNNQLRFEADGDETIRFEVYAK